MDPRIPRLDEQYARIEALMRSLDDRLRHVEIDLAEVKGRITQLPSTWAMITTMLGGQIALAGFLAAILRLAWTH